MPKILIAEDEPDIRDLVMITLQFAGFDVVATNNGAELVEQAPGVKPDLILTDVRMPKMTGYEACRILRAMPELEGVPIVFLSAKGQEEEVKAGLAVGGADYILKPFAPDVLANRVRDILAKPRETRAEPPKPAPPPPTPARIPEPPRDRFATKPLNPILPPAPGPLTASPIHLPGPAKPVPPPPPAPAAPPDPRPDAPPSAPSNPKPDAPPPAPSSDQPGTKPDAPPAVKPDSEAKDSQSKP